MAYDEDLANRIRELIAGEPDVTEKRMFGGLAFLVGEFFVFDFSAYRDTLTVTPVKGEISPLNFRAKPWRRTSETPSRRYFSKRCPPPTAALRD
jgi:hypothetical protein